ncbi:hypothetical protein LCI18_001986 [Fusarium solani-melongenae]|uniref:Uncharacterized protein n=1 Tax=Fusarium solani subsp. cucurbitae TaxID=2747967 RepID=A0ACD3YQ90_FUSSC|nr:hypothetical protein LCI18_001986 [Fusarium solani-melongenae]
MPFRKTWQPCSHLLPHLPSPSLLDTLVLLPSSTFDPTMPNTSSCPLSPESSLESKNRTGRVDRGDAPSTSSQVCILSHRPETAEGLYVDGPDDDVEPLEGYHDNGYHPVKIGDCFGPSGQYYIQHKLGHGGFATVWLCRDTQHGRYVAVKVMIAEVTPDKIPDLGLSQLDLDVPRAEFVITPLDHFALDGPNRTHQCLVTPLLGPRVAPDLWHHIKQDPDVMLPRIARQAIQALNFLHKNHICHGDFRPANILVRLINIYHLSKDELYALIGPPMAVMVRHVSGHLPTLSPKYLVLQANLAGLTADLWALGCTLFEIRQQLSLFPETDGPDGVLAHMVRLFRKLPEKLWDKWKSRRDFFDDQGRWNRSFSGFSLEEDLKRELKILGAETSTPRSSMTTPEVQQKLLADLLYKLLQYEPAGRLTAEQALEHK